MASILNLFQTSEVIHQHSSQPLTPQRPIRSPFSINAMSSQAQATKRQRGCRSRGISLARRWTSQRDLSIQSQPHKEGFLHFAYAPVGMTLVPCEERRTQNPSHNYTISTRLTKLYPSPDIFQIKIFLIQIFHFNKSFFLFRLHFLNCFSQAIASVTSANRSI